MNLHQDQVELVTLTVLWEELVERQLPLKSHLHPPSPCRDGMSLTDRLTEQKLLEEIPPNFAVSTFGHSSPCEMYQKNSGLTGVIVHRNCRTDRYKKSEESDQRLPFYHFPYFCCCPVSFLFFWVHAALVFLLLTAIVGLIGYVEGRGYLVNRDHRGLERRREITKNDKNKQRRTARRKKRRKKRRRKRSMEDKKEQEQQWTDRLRREYKETTVGTTTWSMKCHRVRSQQPNKREKLPFNQSFLSSILAYNRIVRLFLDHSESRWSHFRQKLIQHLITNDNRKGKIRTAKMERRASRKEERGGDERQDGDRHVRLPFVYAHIDNEYKHIPSGVMRRILCWRNEERNQRTRQTSQAQQNKTQQRASISHLWKQNIRKRSVLPSHWHQTVAGFPLCPIIKQSWLSTIINQSIFMILLHVNHPSALSVLTVWNS